MVDFRGYFQTIGSQRDKNKDIFKVNRVTNMSSFLYYPAYRETSWAGRGDFWQGGIFYKK